MTSEDGYSLSEIVIFPSTPSQRNGIEDLRLVRFLDDDGTVTWFGTYTAYSRDGIRQELLRTFVRRSRRDGDGGNPAQRPAPVLRRDR